MDAYSARTQNKGGAKCGAQNAEVQSVRAQSVRVQSVKRKVQKCIMRGRKMLGAQSVKRKV